VALADVAYANGASHTLMQKLQGRVDLMKLTAFGAWNTAGNTLGVVIAQACAAVDGDGDANRRFMAHHLIEDWGYQTVVRHQTQRWLNETIGRNDPTPEHVESTRIYIAAHLAEFVDKVRIGYRLGEVRLPWARTFEVDFELM
jgi:hypothetical protein